MQTSDSPAILWSDWLSRIHFTLAIVMQLSLGICSCLRAAFVAMPQFDVKFSIMQSETCVVDILVIVIGIHTTITCLLTYLSFVIFLFLVFRDSTDFRMQHLAHNILHKCGFRKVLFITPTIIIILTMQMFSLRYASWHFVFVRNKWLHNFPAVIQILHLLPTTLFFSETTAQGLFLIGVFVLPDMLQAIAHTHAYRHKFDNGEADALIAVIPVWFGEAVFRCLSVAAAQYIEKSLCVKRYQEQMQYTNQADVDESSSDDDYHDPAVQEPAKLPVNPELHPLPFSYPCGEEYSTYDSSHHELAMLRSSIRIPDKSLS